MKSFQRVKNRGKTMAILHHNSFNISMEVCSQLPWRSNLTPPPIFNLLVSTTNPGFLFVKKIKKSQQLCHCSSVKIRKGQQFCHCSSASSSGQQLQELMADDDDGEGLDGNYGNRKGQFGNLVKDHGWLVRRMVEEDYEMRSVANVQAEAFYEPLILFNDVFLKFFQAEVLSGLLYRLRNSPPDRYACLVAEPITSNDQQNQQLVGVVDVTVFKDESVLKHLSGVDEYLYVSGIAVLHNFRRKKAASVLLKACEILARLWGHKYLVLRAYEDDLGAQKLYMNAGYTIVSRDPLWTTSWIGRRRRILMIKQCNETRE